MQQWASFFRNQ